MPRHRHNGTHRAANKNRRRSHRFKFVPPRSLHEYSALPPKYQELWNDIGQIVTDMRAGPSLPHASRKFGRDPRTVRHLAKPALRKLRNGRWGAKSYDHLLRVLPLPSKNGLREIALRDSRQATVLGEYWNALGRYISTGDASRLTEFRGKFIIDENGKRIRLLTTLKQLDRLASAGVFSFESLYARAAS